MTWHMHLQRLVPDLQHLHRLFVSQITIVWVGVPAQNDDVLESLSLSLWVLIRLAMVQDSGTNNRSKG